MQHEVILLRLVGERLPAQREVRICKAVISAHSASAKNNRLEDLIVCVFIFKGHWQTCTLTA